jgi:hypothetical protein
LHPMINEHSVFPVTSAELNVLISRLENFAGRVMSVHEWQAILSAVRQVIPRRNREVVAPSEVSLPSFVASDGGRILAATLGSFSSPETYKNNQRYHISNWITLVRNFYELACYTVPAQTLGFALEFLKAARKYSDDSFVLALSVVAKNEPMLVRQVASRVDLDRWRASLADRLEESLRTGVEHRDSASDGELEVDDYDQWYFEAQEILDLAAQFYNSFAYPLPNDSVRLKDVMEDFERPAEKNDDDSETFDRAKSAGSERDFWTIERMFEDL